MTTTDTPAELNAPARGTYAYGDLGRLISLMTGDEKHSTSATSTLDVLWVLYDRVLRVDPSAPGDPGRDRFLLSKGHGPAAYYAVLAAKGGDRLHLVRETADLWFHCLILLARRGLGPGDVLAELHRREGISGIDEKAARDKR